jgi:hypothetical protein
LELGASSGEVIADRFASAPGLNDWRFALANGSLAFAYATSKPKGENCRTNYNH